MDKKKLITILVCIAVAVLLLVFILTRDGCKTPDTTDEQTQKQLALIKNAKLETNEDRLYLLTSLGWEVEIEPEAYSEVLIPEEFSDVYENYNKIQKTMGLDLSKYKGDKVMRYTYVVVNYPGEKDVRATLLVYKNRLIGGDVCTVRLDGFMHNLLMPKNDDSETAATTAVTQQSAATTAATDEAGVQTGEYTDVNYDDASIYPSD
jgi:hypothetical protein